MTRRRRAYTEMDDLLENDIRSGEPVDKPDDKDTNLQN